MLSAVAQLAVVGLVGPHFGESRTSMVATNVAEGRGYTFCNPYFPFCGPGNEVTAAVEPVPVLLYAALRMLLGAASLKAILGLQIALGMAIVLIGYAIAMQVFGRRRIALLVAFLMATYYPALRLTAAVEAEPLFMFFVTLGFLFFVKGMAGNRPGWWAVAGALFGLAAMCRSAFVYFPIVALVLMFPLTKAPLFRRAVNSAILFLAFSAMLAPWIVRNAIVFHGFIPGGTLVGYNLYRHNHTLGEGSYLRYVPPDEAEEAVGDLVKRRTDLRGDENEYEMDQVYWSEAKSIIAAHPLQYVVLSLYRFLPLWLDLEINRGLRTPAMMWTAFENAVLLLLAGLVVMKRRLAMPPGAIVMVALLGYFTAGHMLVVARLRYVMPVVPFLIVLAADQVARILDGLRRFSTGPV